MKTNTGKTNQTQAPKADDKTPAQATQPQSQASPENGAPAAPVSPDGAPAGDGKKSRKAGEKVRLRNPVSNQWVRAYKSQVYADAAFTQPGPGWPHTSPEQGSQPFVVDDTRGGGSSLSAEERQTRKQQKEAEKARVAAMSPEEKAAWQAQRAAEREAAKKQKQQANMNRIMEYAAKQEQLAKEQGRTLSASELVTLVLTGSLPDGTVLATTPPPAAAPSAPAQG